MILSSKHHLVNNIFHLHHLHSPVDKVSNSLHKVLVDCHQVLLEEVQVCNNQKVDKDNSHHLALKVNLLEDLECSNQWVDKICNLHLVSLRCNHLSEDLKCHHQWVAKECNNH